MRIQVLGVIRNFAPPDQAIDAFIYEAVTGHDPQLLPEIPALTTDIRQVVAFAEQVLDCHAVDIEVAVRYVSGKRHGRAEICGPMAMGDCRAHNEAMALSGALVAALINGIERKKP